MFIKNAVGALLTIGLAVAQAQGSTKPLAKPAIPVAPFQSDATASAALRATAEARGDSTGPVADLRWEIRASDVTLARTFERWAAVAGHKVKWDAARNFLVGASDTYVGSFEGALLHVLSSPGIRFSDYPLEACIYANTPPLVRITRQGEQMRECPAVAAR